MKGEGVTQNMTQRKQAVLQMAQKKLIQASSFLLMHCDLRRKLEVVSLKGQSTDDISKSPETAC